MSYASMSWLEPDYAKERKTSQQLFRRLGCKDFDPDVWVWGAGGKWCWSGQTCLFQEAGAP